MEFKVKVQQYLDSKFFEDMQDGKITTWEADGYSWSAKMYRWEDSWGEWEVMVKAVKKDREYHAWVYPDQVQVY